MEDEVRCEGLTGGSIEEERSHRFTKAYSFYTQTAGTESLTIILKQKGADIMHRRLSTSSPKPRPIHTVRSRA